MFVITNSFINILFIFIFIHLFPNSLTHVNAIKYKTLKTDVNEEKKTRTNIIIIYRNDLACNNDSLFILSLFSCSPFQLAYLKLKVVFSCNFGYYWNKNNTIESYVQILTPKTNGKAHCFSKVNRNSRRQNNQTQTKTIKMYVKSRISPKNTRTKTDNTCLLKLFTQILHYDEKGQKTFGRLN